jgi:hypothetical protein
MLPAFELEKLSPLRSPRWRCDRVVTALQIPNYRLPRFSGGDYPVRLFYRYLSVGAAARNDRQRDALNQDYPDAAQAHSMHYSPAIERRQILEASLLTDESFSQIATRMGMSEPAVKLYAALFFDVRDRLTATTWILKVIMGSPEMRTRFNQDGTLTEEQRGFIFRLFAYYGGPLALEAMVAGIAGVSMPMRPDDVPT